MKIIIKNREKKEKKVKIKSRYLYITSNVELH